MTDKTTTTTIPAGSITVGMVTAGAEEVANYYDDGNDLRHREVARFVFQAMQRAAPSAAQTDALADERGVSKLCMDLLKEMHEAPTMEDGYDLLADFTAYAGLGTPTALKSKQPAADRIGYIPLPPILHPDTVKLVCTFAAALAERLALSENKPNRGSYWQRTDWRDELVTELQRHVTKGDPLDVAAYCAFAWHHQWSVTPAQPTQGSSVSEAATVAMVIPYTDEDDRPDMDEWRMISIGLPGGIPDHVLDRIPKAAAPILCDAINGAARAAQPVGDVVEKERELIAAVLHYADTVDSFFSRSTCPPEYNDARSRIREAIGALRSGEGR